jgi:hypothetical protein
MAEEREGTALSSYPFAVREGWRETSELPLKFWISHHGGTSGS